MSAPARMASAIGGMVAAMAGTTVSKISSSSSVIPSMECDVALVLTKHSSDSAGAERPLLARLSIDDIIRFRDSTAKIRGEFVEHVERAIRKRLNGVSDAAALEIEMDDLMHEIRKQLDDYSNELMSIRDNLWPKLLSNRNIISVASALAAAVFLGGHFTLAASIIPSISIVQTILERRRERRIVERHASPALAYLAQVKALRGS